MHALAEKLRDPMLLEKRCRVCAWSVDGCPGCWRPGSKRRGYNKRGGDTAFARGGGVNDTHGGHGTFAASAVTHTKQVGGAGTARAAIVCCCRLLLLPCLRSLCGVAGSA